MILQERLKNILNTKEIYKKNLVKKKIKKKNLPEKDAHTA